MVLELPKSSSIDLCEGCFYTKQTRKSFPVGQAWRALKCLELIQAYLCGPMQTESLGWNCYFLLFTDDNSRMSWVYFLKTNQKLLRNFRNLKLWWKSKVAATSKFLAQQ